MTLQMLASATAISITFEFQKTDVRSETVHQHATGLELLCPIIMWSRVVRRILAYPGCDEESLVSAVVINDARKLVTASFLAAELKAAAAWIGEDVLGFPPDDIGTHSIRPGAAMAMYLAGVPVFTIMLIGRWSSDAFLRYIRRQVLQFSVGVSKRMVSDQAQDFFTIPDIDPEHPRTRAHRTNYHPPPTDRSEEKPKALHPGPRFRIPLAKIRTNNMIKGGTIGGTHPKFPEGTNRNEQQTGEVLSLGLEA
jgi:hypothetical protein